MVLVLAIAGVNQQLEGLSLSLSFQAKLIKPLKKKTQKAKQTNRQKKPGEGHSSLYLRSTRI